MTSRLKRKLGELGVDTSSRKANENFCQIGTPLPPLEKSKDTGEFVPLWKQEVRDEKGRRRLHGAFTGGWSAGYFNSVGSKEGWTPSTFVSSRSDRVKKQAARPEDFMDEEDLQDLKDSRNIVDTTEEMDLIGGTQAELRTNTNDDETEPDPIQLTLQSTLLPPPKSSIGAKILQKMGWRAGQGIGPRVSLARRRAQDAQAYNPLTGARLMNGRLEISEEDEEAKKHSYAARDVPILSVQRKDNAHGLGYVPGTTLHSTLGASSSSSGASGPRLAGGFGLGALNEADEDDLDVYDSLHHPTTSQRVAYDHIDGVDDDIGSSGTGKPDAGQTKGTNNMHSTAPSSHLRDGKEVLQGFILSDEPVAQDKWFPLPDIPQGWKPNPRRLWDGNKENENTTVPPQVTAQHAQGQPQSHAKWRSSQLSADQRGSLLGETPLRPGPAKSVFEYMSEKDKERIQRIASNLASGKTGSTPGVHPSFATTSATPTTIPPPTPTTTPTIHLEPHVAQAALHGFQPFTTDPVKQTRYTSFLQSFASGSTTSSLQPLPDQTSEEFTQERSEFSKAAALFKPMSGAMQGRFISASVLDLGPRIIEGLHQPSSSQVDSDGKGNDTVEEVEREKEEEENMDPRVNAAKMGMYGPLTREAKPWVPARLLCKRFGVRDPDVNLETKAEVAKPGQSSELSMVPSSSSSVTAGVNVDGTKVGTGGGPRDITNLGLGEDETQGRDILTYERPPVDVFKAIFASDDEDEDDRDEEGTEMAGGDEKGDEGMVAGKGGGFTSATVVLEDNYKPDLETFKPKFVPRQGGRDQGKEKEDKEGKKEKKDKKAKRKKEKGKDKKVLVSFELDETRVEDDFREPKRPTENRPAKKRRKERGGDPEGGHGGAIQMDTSPPGVNGTSSAVVQSSIASTDDPGVVTQGRKRAVDFMD